MINIPAVTLQAMLTAVFTCTCDNGCIPACSVTWRNSLTFHPYSGRYSRCHGCKPGYSPISFSYGQGRHCRLSRSPGHWHPFFYWNSSYGCMSQVSRCYRMYHGLCIIVMYQSSVSNSLSVKWAWYNLSFHSPMDEVDTMSKVTPVRALQRNERVGIAITNRDTYTSLPLRIARARRVSEHICLFLPKLPKPL